MHKINGITKIQLSLDIFF